MHEEDLVGDGAEIGRIEHDGATFGERERRHVRTPDVFSQRARHACCRDLVQVIAELRRVVHEGSEQLLHGCLGRIVVEGGHLAQVRRRRHGRTARTHQHHLVDAIRDAPEQLQGEHAAHRIAHEVHVVEPELIEQGDHRLHAQLEERRDAEWRVERVRRVTEPDDVGRDAAVVVAERADRALPVRQRGGARPGPVQEHDRRRARNARHAHAERVLADRDVGRGDGARGKFFGHLLASSCALRDGHRWTGGATAGWTGGATGRRARAVRLVGVLGRCDWSACSGGATGRRARGRGSSDRVRPARQRAITIAPRSARLCRRRP